MDFNLWNNNLITFNLYKKSVIIGIGSKCNDNKHILHLDLDDKTYDTCLDIIKYLQNKYLLSNALLLQSSKNSYHAVFFDKLDFKEMIRIQKSINLKHGCMSEMKGESTIRLSSKFDNFIKLLGITYSNHNIYKKSNAHLVVFANKFKFKHLLSKFKNLDKSNKVNIFSYSKRLKIW